MMESSFGCYHEEVMELYKLLLLEVLYTILNNRDWLHLISCDLLTLQLLNDSEAFFA